MTRIAAAAGLAAIAWSLIPADLAAQEPRHAGDIDYGGVIAGSRAGGAGGPSRDFNELGLVRTPDGYTLPNGDAAPAEPAPTVSRIVREFVREIRRAQNLLVIKTTAGSAQPVAFAVDAEGWEEVVGTVAGDDTVLVIAPDNKTAKRLQTRLEEMRA